MEDDKMDVDQPQENTKNKSKPKLPNCYVMLGHCPSPTPSDSTQDVPTIPNPTVAAVGASDSPSKTQSPKKRVRLTPEERQ